MFRVSITRTHAVLILKLKGSLNDTVFSNQLYVYGNIIKVGTKFYSVTYRFYVYWMHRILKGYWNLTNYFREYANSCDSYLLFTNY